jgi:arylsulfatase A-like enzyme
MEFLEEEGLDENTMLIYTSDNGYHFGEHGIGDKRSAYEVSMRIPMLVRYPKSQVNGKVLDNMVLNIDVAPTILDLAGLPIPDKIQGRSWKPILEGETNKVRDHFLYEYFFSYTDITDYEIQTANPPITPTIVALRTDRAKLITYPGRTWVELFDIANDPYERENLADDPQYKDLLQEMQAKLKSEKERLEFEIPEKAKYVPDDHLEDWRK